MGNRVGAGAGLLLLYHRCINGLQHRRRHRARAQERRHLKHLATAQILFLQN